MVDIPITVNVAVITAVITANGQTDVDFDFLIFDRDHVKAIFTELATGIQTDLTNVADFTIDGVEDPNGETLTLLAISTLIGDTVTMYRSIPVERLADYQQGGDFLADTINRELDIQTQMMQEFRRDIDTTVKFPIGESGNNVLPKASDRINKFMGFDGVGDVSVFAGASGVPVSTYMATLLDDTTAEEAQATLEIDIVYGNRPLLLASTETARGTGGIWKTHEEVFLEAAAAADELTVGGVNLWEYGSSFTTLARFKAAIARGDVYEQGNSVHAEGGIYHFLDDGNTDIAGLTGWELVALKATTDAIDTEQTTQNNRLTVLEALDPANPNPKEEVAVATTANITLSGEQTIDTVATSSSRVLVKDQTDASENGIYVSAAGAWARSADMNTDAEVDFASVFIAGGSSNIGETWMAIVSSITLGTDDMPWVLRDNNSASLGRTEDLEEASDFVAGVAAVFRNIKKLRLFGADMTKFYSVHYFFWNDSGTRFNFTVYESTDFAGTGATDVATFSVGSSSYTGNVEFTLAEVGGSGITGTLVVDFDNAGASFAFYGGDFAGSAIRPDRQITTEEDVYADGRTATLIAAEAIRTDTTRIPFVSNMDTDWLRSIVRDVHLYGVDPTHDYIVSRFDTEEFTGIPLTRFIITIRDITDGVDLCSFKSETTSVVTVAAHAATLPNVIKLTDNPFSTGTKVYATMEVDWTKVVDDANAYTTMDGAGLHSDFTLSDEQLGGYLQDDHWDQIVRCGAGETYTTLRLAVESVYSSVTGSTLINGSPICEEASFHNRVLIDLVDDATFVATDLDIPEWVDIRGMGKGRTFISKENSNADPILQQHASGKILDCTILTETAGQYSIHSDDINRDLTLLGPQNRRIRQSYKRVHLQAAEGHNSWIYGCGISSGQHILFEDVIGEHLDPTATLPAFGFHNTGPTISDPSLKASISPSIVEMNGCSSPDQLGVYVQSLEDVALCVLSLRNCNFNLIHNTIATGGEVITDLAADRYGWVISGVHDGAILQDDPTGMIVLGTTAGQTPSGDAAALIFGNTDELGRGDKWVKTGTTKSLGARLGDCSTTSKTLTIGAQSHVFSTDQTALSNATIIAAINGSITLNNVAEVDIQYEIFPDTGYTRRMKNSSGSTISAGTFVKETAAGVIAVCGSSDDILGWVYRDILNGNNGHVVTTKKIAAEYITGATADGRFGLTAAGLLDYGATTKVGYVQSGIVNLY